MSMFRWSTYNEVYRMKPTKRFPKGLRVRKAITDEVMSGKVGVVSVRDGHMFFANPSELVLE